MIDDPNLKAAVNWALLSLKESAVEAQDFTSAARLELIRKAAAEGDLPSQIDLCTRFAETPEGRYAVALSKLDAYDVAALREEWGVSNEE